MKVKNKPPIHFFICIAIILSIYFFLPHYSAITPPYNWFGILFLCLGAYLNIGAERIMKQHGTPHKFEKSVRVVQEGVFTISRNPMYLGMTLILIGFALISKNVATFISPLGFFLSMNILFIPYEERKMTQELGEDYVHYKQKVRRWL